MLASRAHSHRGKRGRQEGVQSESDTCVRQVEANAARAGAHRVSDGRQGIHRLCAVDEAPRRSLRHSTSTVVIIVLQDGLRAAQGLRTRNDTHHPSEQQSSEGKGRTHLYMFKEKTGHMTIPSQEVYNKKDGRATG